MQFKKGLETREFAAALLHEILRYRSRQPHPIHSYIHRGFYARQIARLFEIFPRQQCLILRSEDVLARHDQTMAQVFRFLGVRPYLPPAGIVHSGTYTPISPLLSRLLRLVFRRDTRRLEVILGWDCRAWRQF